MTSRRRSSRNGIAIPILLTLTVLIPVAGADAQEEAAPAAVTAPDSEEARAILKEMATFLAAQKKFRVEIACAHDSVQPSGQKIEFLDKRTVTVRRPHDLRMEVVRSDGERTQVVMNAESITAQLPDEGVYAQIPARASLDESIQYFVSELHMRLPLAALLVSTLAEDLSRRVVQADYVERTTILSEPADHIAGSTDSVDFQIWIAAGKRPLPLRIVLTYREAEGQPQFRAMFSKWELSPLMWASTFQPKVPRDARRIAFLSQVKTASRTVDNPSSGADR